MNTALMVRVLQGLASQARSEDAELTSIDVG